jgi:hypothetical protein
VQVEAAFPDRERLCPHQLKVHPQKGKGKCPELQFSGGLPLCKATRPQRGAAWAAAGSCCYGGSRANELRLLFAPVIIFYSLMPDGNGDELSQHTACPLGAGEGERKIKWSANKWVWNERQQ